MENLYQRMCEANATIQTTNIKGKDYAEVPQRIKAFRMVYPDGYIDTVLLSDKDGVAHFKAEVGCYDEDGCRKTLGTGHAYEKETSSFINKTSYIENCETSAVGRALGMAGFGIDISVASAEEVQNAILNQGKKEPAQPALDYTQEVTPAQYRQAITDEQIDTILNAVEKYPKLADYIVEHYGSVPKMTKEQADEVLAMVEKKNAGRKA